MWLNEAFWATLPKAPPYDLDQEFLSGSEEVLASFREDCPWLFPPAFGEAAPEPLPAQDAGAGAPAPPGVAAPLPPEPPVHFEFARLRSEDAQRVVGLLLTPPAEGPGAGSLATRVGKALRSFVAQAYQVLSEVAPNGQPRLPEFERQHLAKEAESAMKALMADGRVKAESDLIFCLEAFGVSKGRSQTEQDWISQCLTVVLKAGWSAAEPSAVEGGKEGMRSRIRHETGELYSCIDVRSWPRILELVGGDGELLDPDTFKHQVSYQLCMARGRDWYNGLLQAARLLSELRMADCFTALELCEIFNDRLHFDRRQRQDLLYHVLHKAPRELTMEVLRKIDGDDVDIDERDDEELVLVRALVQQLREDIRNCKHAFFKMKSDWLVFREWARYKSGSGVVYNQEMTPDQVCDHIEDEDNHEELLKLVVHTYVKADRKSEAAQMLARPKSRATRCFDNNRNDKELSYLISVYEDVEPPEDQFGPMEQYNLALPCRGSDVLYVADAGSSLAQLEEETLGSGRPLAVGVWWFWRCFDARLDLWPRASIMVLAYEGRLAIVDLMLLESSTEATEVKGKDLVRRIMQAPQLLKVVHGLSASALQALQRAAVPRAELAAADGSLVLPELSPVMDLSLLMAYVRRSPPVAPGTAKLTGHTFAYFRLELCQGECLSNFERRPLRLSQQHYALTLAWYPLLTLRALCAYSIVEQSQVGQLLLQAGGAGASWDDALLQKVSFGVEAPAEAQRASFGVEPPPEMDGVFGGRFECAPNLWDQDEWQKAQPRPDPKVNIGTSLQVLGQMLLPPEAAAQAQPSVATLFDIEVARQELKALHDAYRSNFDAKAQQMCR